MLYKYTYIGEKDNTLACLLLQEQIEEALSQNPSSQSETVSQDDAFAKVCGKEHSGHVRGLGFGPSPSNVFGRSSAFFAAMTSTNTNFIEPQVQQKFQSLESELKSQLE